MPWLGFLVALGVAPFLALGLGRHLAPELGPRPTAAAPASRAQPPVNPGESAGRAGTEGSRATAPDSIFRAERPAPPLDRALLVGPPYEARDAATLRGRLITPGRAQEFADAPIVELRLASVDGPSRFAVCAGPPGASQPWACGLRARIGLVNLLASRPLRCEPGPEPPGFRPPPPRPAPAALPAQIPAQVSAQVSAQVPAPVPVATASAGPASPVPSSPAPSSPASRPSGASTAAAFRGPAAAEPPAETSVLRVPRAFRCTLDDGAAAPLDVAREMVRAGWLQVGEGGSRHRPLEDEARAANRGAWSAGRFAAPPAGPGAASGPR